MNSPVVPSPAGEHGGPPAAKRTDYAGAVYGSMLAASVVATAGVVGQFPRVQLAVMLIVTGLVFWAAHVYARLAGERLVGQAINWREIRLVAGHEWSIVEAALLPAAVVLISPVLGLGLSGTGWLALGVAVAQQVIWACLGAVRAGASRRQAAVEGLANLVLGLIIVAAKAALGH
ncbi:hypothetical protein GCM10009665_41640 [Kitasatospora nipponensis]|uniref:Integral membrane protein n=1 Tax=Kitasatospora nipponensis TaxID=258049 RepID=A0ABP4H0L2_9ACTN